MRKAPGHSTTLLLFALGAACLAVGMMWWFQNRFEAELVEGRMSPDAAFGALERLHTSLLLLFAVVAAALSGVFAWLLRRLDASGLWPPSGDWPAPRALRAEERPRYRRGLQAAAALSFALAAIAGTFALT